MTATINNPLPVKECCPAIRVLWDKDMTGFGILFTEINMEWVDQSGVHCSSPKCIFCGKKFKAIK